MGSSGTTQIDERVDDEVLTQQLTLDEELCDHSPMLKTAQFTSYRLAHHTPSYYRPASLCLNHTHNLHSSTHICAPITTSQPSSSSSSSKSPSKSKFQTHIEDTPEYKTEAIKMAGNKANAPPKHEMVYFKGLASSVRRFGDFRTVLHTGLYSQVVAMEVPVGGEIGDEVHTVDQILLFTSGKGLATVSGKDQEVNTGDVVVVPAGTQHQFVTRGDQPLELITIYSPAEHKTDTVHKTKEEGDKEEDDGIDEAPEWSQKSKSSNEDAGLVREDAKY